MGQLKAKHNNQPCSVWTNHQDRQNYERMRLQVEQLKKKQDYIIEQQTKKQ
jgi:hypothetical protein